MLYQRYKQIWRKFEDARKFVHKQELNSETDWREWSKYSRPEDIPSNPDREYKNDGWISWGDWLGTNRIATQIQHDNFLPFGKARKFVRSLKLKGSYEWYLYCQSGKKPESIPAKPERTYSHHWKGYQDWLGYETEYGPRKNWLPFENAREYVRSLNLRTSTDFYELCRTNEIPENIPRNPCAVYENYGWAGWSDFVGHYSRKKIFLEYEEAKKVVHSLELKSANEWYDYCSKIGKPDNIPRRANKIYADNGWISWKDFLGYDKIKNKPMQHYLTYKKARTFARKLKLKSSTEWRKFAGTKQRPQNIPFNPKEYYRDKGWIDWSDFLGYSKWIGENFLPFKEARNFIHSLKFKSKNDWYEYCKSKKRPLYIPSNPERFYKDNGWISWGDWLGSGTIATQQLHHNFLSFKKARKFVHKLRLGSKNEWFEYCKSGYRPRSIPSNPQLTYKDEGWNNWADWLGKKQ